VFSQLRSTVDSTKFPNVYRWFKHISFFTPCVRAKWPGKVEEKKAAESPAKKAGGSPAKKPAAAPAKKADDSDDELNVKLGDSDDDDDAAAKLIAKKAAEKAAKDAAAGPDKPKKTVIAKSTLVLDVKPNEAETDLNLLEKKIRGITQEGLLWGACEKKPVAYGIFKLRIVAVVVDDLVSTDSLQEEIEAFEEVQSTDIHAFNKI